MTAIAFIGFGEAGAAFARAGDFAFDVKTTLADAAENKRRDYTVTGVRGCETAEEAIKGVTAVLSLVTADQALVAAKQYAPLLPPNALWLDMNSVAPGTKRASANIVEACGGRYVDVAVMAPVVPARWAVPLTVSGPHSAAAAASLRAIGFTNVSVAGGKIGDASAIKMIRSVMVKGIEALTAEMMLAASRADVVDAVLSSLDGSKNDQNWTQRADYNLDRMFAHGLRRAAEMEEVAKTLTELGVEPNMTMGTIARQRTLGELGILPPEGIRAKISVLNHVQKEQEA